MSNLKNQTTVVMRTKPGKTYPQVNDIFDIQKSKINISDLQSNIQKGQLVVSLQYMSCDAAMRVWMSGAKTYVDPVLPGDKMFGWGVAKVISTAESAKYKEGDLIQAYLKWENYQVIPEKGTSKIPKNYPNPSHFLGIFGISGLTAYFGFFDIGKPKKGETVVISAASGAVGEIAIQLAKAHGCKVIGIAGSEQKCNYVTQVLKADECINYKDAKDFKELLGRLQAVTPNGIDVYFDNVGGDILDAVLKNLNMYARIIMCGAISQYNVGPKSGLKYYTNLVLKRGSMEGFIVLDYAKRYHEAISHIGGLIKSKQIIFREDMQIGLHNGPDGLQKLLLGKNQGKIIIDATKDDQINSNSAKL